MRNWVPWVLVFLFGWVCLRLALPAPVTGALVSYMQFVTISGWVAVVCIVAFLIYALSRTNKR